MWFLADNLIEKKKISFSLILDVNTGCWFQNPWRSRILISVLSFSTIVLKPHIFQNDCSNFFVFHYEYDIGCLVLDLNSSSLEVETRVRVCIVIWAVISWCWLAVLSLGALHQNISSYAFRFIGIKLNDIHPKNKVILLKMGFSNVRQ